MSNKSLPDDPARWPRDPFRLLGVGDDSDLVSLRRAYTQLIRRFKPEHFPEQFRRIREAYDEAKRRAEWRAAARTPWSEDDEDPPTNEPAANSRVDGVTRGGHSSPDAEPERPESESNNGTPGRPAPPRPRPPSLERQLDELWDLACEGGHAAAYPRLVELASAGEPCEELLLRLYWLLVAAPELDAVRRPRDWLARAVRTVGLTRRLAAIYADELSRDATALDSFPVGELLNLRAPRDALSIAGRARWRTASEREDRDLIHADLDQLQTKIPLDARDHWLAMLIDAMPFLVWTRDAQRLVAVDVWREELEERGYSHAHVAAALNSFDFLFAVAADWRKTLVNERASDALAIARLAWVGPDWALRAAVERMAIALTGNAKRSLFDLDRLAAKAPALMAQARNSLLDCCSASLAEDGRGDETYLRNRVVALFAPAPYEIYEAKRLKLLAFCCQERISPQRLANLAAELDFLPRKIAVEIPRRLCDDIPLHCLFLAEVIVRG